MAVEGAPRVVSLIDESFCLALIGTRVETLRAAVAAHEPGTLGISAVTAAALHRRALRSADPERNQRALAQFLLPLEVVEFGAAAAQRLPLVERAASGASGPALLVAAQALALDAAVLTCLPDLYAGIDGLRLAAVPVEPQARALPPAAQPTALTLSRTILAVGSHDPTLDLVGERLHVLDPGINVCTAHVGSLDGLLALRRGEAHLAGCHLLDEETGAYNLPHVRRLLAPHGVRAVLVGFVMRVQGLLVARGNPKRIEHIADLARPDVRFANRRPGAGTRVRLDHALQVAGIAPDRVAGYEHELPSHAAVAAAVAAGAADCGLGIQAAAQAHGLGFVPLFEEEYDLVIPVEHYESALLAPLLALLRRPDGELLQAVAALGGYTTERMGVVQAEC
jgi:molybdate-binding protein/predicted nucleic acid-binding protein